MIRITFRKKTTQVQPAEKQTHANALGYIWTNSKLSEERDEQGNVLKWRQLGFSTEDLTQEFVDVGALGLDSLVRS